MDVSNKFFTVPFTPDLETEFVQYVLKITSFRTISAFLNRQNASVKINQGSALNACQGLKLLTVFAKRFLSIKFVKKGIT